MTHSRCAYLITGAASGIGRATAQLLAGPDADLLLHTGSNREGLEEVARSVSGRGARVEVVVDDLADPDLPNRVAQVAQSIFGGLDALIAVEGLPGPRDGPIPLPSSAKPWWRE
jgi:NAD(P)-dependent dehydrogenase (short-subunit alcohol dehydrogenase family)